VHEHELLMQKEKIKMIIHKVPTKYLADRE
jgi:hypothetical protein